MRYRLSILMGVGVFLGAMTILVTAKPAYAEISETEWVGQKN